jgi:hypothetical protein
MIDMTYDTPFESEWRPIKQVGKRVPEKKVKATEPIAYTFDRRPIDYGVFVDFEDHGDKYLEFKSPEEANKHLEFWKEEQQ